MTEPTEEQTKEFWEWCGFKKVDHPTAFVEWAYLYPDGNLYSFKGFPHIDLNNLFRYAVPKVRYQIILKNIRDGWHCMMYNSQAEPLRTAGFNADPALALFWALWQVKEEK